MSIRSERIRNHYTPRVQNGRASYDILDWGSPESQIERFRVLAKAIRETIQRPAVPRLLDVGCGLCDLATHLEEVERLPVAYVGVDLTPAIIQEARRRHPQRELLLADLFTASPLQAKSVDIAYCSGVFNLNLGNNREFVRNAVPRLLELSRQLVVVNFLHERTPDQYEHCFYYSPDELCREFAPFAQRIECRDDYLINDFTLVIQP